MRLHIPASIVVPACIEQGSVFHFEAELQNSDGSTYRGGRYFIVLNVNPKSDELLVLTTTTTKITKTEDWVRRVGEDPLTVVRITPSDFAPFKKDCAVNCNNTHPMSRDELIAKLDQPEGEIFTDKLPKAFVESLVRGVLKSTQVPQEQKRLLL